MNLNLFNNLNTNLIFSVIFLLASVISTAQAPVINIDREAMCKTQSYQDKMSLFDESTASIQAQQPSRSIFPPKTQNFPHSVSEVKQNIRSAYAQHFADFRDQYEKRPRWKVKKVPPELDEAIGDYINLKGMKRGDAHALLDSITQSIHQPEEIDTELEQSIADNLERELTYELTSELGGRIISQKQKADDDFYIDVRGGNDASYPLTIGTSIKKNGDFVEVREVWFDGFDRKIVGNATESPTYSVRYDSLPDQLKKLLGDSETAFKTAEALTERKDQIEARQTQVLRDKVDAASAPGFALYGFMEIAAAGEEHIVVGPYANAVSNGNTATPFSSKILSLFDFLCLEKPAAPKISQGRGSPTSVKSAGAGPRTRPSTTAVQSFFETEGH